MADAPREIILNIDGGSRGNPGPAGAGVVIRRADTGQIIHQAGHFIGHATNNVAEYSALLEGLKKAVAIGSAAVTILSDSELLVRQMTGVYRVKNANLQPMHAEAQRLARRLGRFEIRHVPREQNAQADDLANQAMDARKDVLIRTPASSPAKPPAAKADDPQSSEPANTAGLPTAIVCQFDIAWEQPERNFETVSRLLRGCAIPPGSLIVLPEMFATGFTMNADLAVDARPATEQFLGRLATEHSAYILAGLAGLSPAGRPRNEALAVDPQGQTVARFAKLHSFTFDGEDEHYTAGEEVVTFSWAGLTVAPFICYDLRFPEAFRLAARRGAEVLAVLANWPAVRKEHWRALVAARAVENQAYVIAANRVGSSPRHSYAGESQIVDPLGRASAQADDRPCVLRASLDARQLGEYRRRFPALADIRNDLLPPV